MKNGYIFPLGGNSGGGGGGGESTIAWKPNVNANGDLSWSRSNSTTAPTTQNIRGEKGENGKSNYEIWIEAGNTGSEEDFIESLKGGNGDPGENGKSAYELWLELGNTGSEEDFLESLKGADGFSPVVTVTETDNGHKVSIEDKDGVKEFEVLDGEDAEVAEILHTDLSGNLDGITTVLGLVNALLEEYRAERKNVRFESGSYSNTNLTDLPQPYGYLTIKVGGTNIVEVTFAYSNVGFKSMYYGFLNRTSSETLYSELKWEEVTKNEILLTSLSGNLAGITTVLDLVNALVTEYRALSPKKPIRFISGEITKTTLTDLPTTYGLLQIAVFGYDLVEVSFAGSSFGFKTMYYGFVNRTSSETLFSSLFWEMVDTPITELTDLGLDSTTFTIQNTMDKLSVGQHCIINTYYLTDRTEVMNIAYGKLEIRRLTSTMWSLWLEDVINGGVYVGKCVSSQFGGWVQYVSKDYVDNLIADLQAQINALKS